MKLTKITIIFLISLFFASCVTIPINKNNPEKKYFTSSGFALIYDDSLFEKKIVNTKINNEKIHVLHKFLKINTTVKLTNPTNSKFIVAKIYKKADYPNIFNLLISQKVANVLELNAKNPYLEIVEVKKNETFIAKKSNIFDEEKNVAEKAPVDEVLMNDLNPASKNYIKQKDQISFILVINDFYYFESAKRLKKQLSKKTKINNLSIKKINIKKYRLFAGPFKNFSTLKTAYISLNKLGFENLNIYKK